MMAARARYAFRLAFAENGLDCIRNVPFLLKTMGYDYRLYLGQYTRRNAGRQKGLGFTQPRV
jgi:hypothetical protein